MKIKALIIAASLVFAGSSVAYSRFSLDCQQHHKQGHYFYHTKHTNGLYLPAYQYPRYGFYGKHYHRFTAFHSQWPVRGFYRCYNPEGLSVECFRQ